MSVLNKKDALKIAKKLDVEIDTSPKAHDLAIIRYRGVEVTSFGVRRGRKDLGHDHVMRSLYVSPREARKLADCSMSKTEWVDKMKEKGFIAEETHDGGGR